MKKQIPFQMSRILFPALCIALLLSTCSRKSLPEGVYKNGLVVSAHEIASRVGVDILKKGGNAVDAAVAVSYALAVVYPVAGNIGGGSFIVIRTPDGFSTTIDCREKAPAKAARDMYLDKNGNIIPDLSTIGALASGVPGTVAGTLYALEKYGTMRPKEVIQPTIELAENGWVLDRPMGGDEFKRFSSTNAVFNKSDGSPYEIGERWVQKDLAGTLRDIAEKGRDGFYKGRVADLIVASMQTYGGIITREDLANYEPVERPPITGTYRGYGIVSMPPPSSGGICLIELLNILERYDIRSLGWNTAETVHLMVEAERRVYADRNAFLADPDFVELPVSTLISKSYADTRAKDIDPSRATPSDMVAHGNAIAFGHESEQTTHYSVIDKEGIAVSVTTTINGSYGNYLVVEGAGFLLNNEMDDFSTKTGTPTHEGLVYGEANRIEPGKRMLSSMTPSIITKDGKNFFIIGSPGGATIITTVLQCIMNVIDHGMSTQEAVEAPRFHHQWFPDQILYEKDKDAFSEKTMDQLKSLGYTSFVPRELGNAQGILIDPETGLYTGGPDPRRSSKNAAIGY